MLLPSSPCLTNWCRAWFRVGLFLMICLVLFDVLVCTLWMRFYDFRWWCCWGCHSPFTDVNPVILEGCRIALLMMMMMFLANLCRSLFACDEHIAYVLLVVVADHILQMPHNWPKRSTPQSRNMSRKSLIARCLFGYRNLPRYAPSTCPIALFVFLPRRNIAEQLPGGSCATKGYLRNNIAYRRNEPNSRNKQNNVTCHCWFDVTDEKHAALWLMGKAVVDVGFAAAAPAAAGPKMSTRFVHKLFERPQGQNPFSLGLKRRVGTCEGANKLFDPHPFAWKTPTPQAGPLDPQKSIICVFFLPDCLTPGRPPLHFVLGEVGNVGDAAHSAAELKWMLATMSNMMLNVNEWNEAATKCPNPMQRGRGLFFPEAVAEVHDVNS